MIRFKIMRTTLATLVISLMAAFALTFVSCGDDAPDAGGEVTATGTATPLPTLPPQVGNASTPNPNATPLPASLRREDAFIEYIEVRFTEGASPQVFVDVVSKLPNGCTRFEKAEVTRTADSVTVAVTNVAPSDQTVACTQLATGTVKITVDLGTGFEKNKRYKLKVNERESTFTVV